MRARPTAVTLIGWLFIAVGVAGTVRGGWGMAHGATASELGPMLASELVAIAGGVWLLRGARWGRWLLVAWMAFHVGLSLLHDVVELALHGVVFAVLVYCLYRPASSAFLQGKARAD